MRLLLFIIIIIIIIISSSSSSSSSSSILYHDWKNGIGMAGIGSPVLGSANSMSIRCDWGDSQFDLIVSVSVSQCVNCLSEPIRKDTLSVGRAVQNPGRKMPFYYSLKTTTTTTTTTTNPAVLNGLVTKMMSTNIRTLMKRFNVQMFFVTTFNNEN